MSDDMLTPYPYLQYNSCCRCLIISRKESKNKNGIRTKDGWGGGGGLVGSKKQEGEKCIRGMRTWMK